MVQRCDTNMRSRCSFFQGMEYTFISSISLSDRLFVRIALDLDLDPTIVVSTLLIIRHITNFNDGKCPITTCLF